MNKKNQHYVPKFHLRKWSYDGKRISLYNKNSEIFIDAKAAIKDVASKDYFYGETDKLENFLGKIESLVAPIYEKIIREKSILNLTSEEKTLLYLYIILGNERTLATAERYEKFVKSMLYEVLETEQANGNYQEINLNTFKDDIVVKCAPNISIKAALELFPLILDLKLVLIKNLSKVELLTSDYPTIKYNLWSVKRKLFSGWGLSSSGIMFICPISPYYALMAYDDSIYNTIEERNEELIIRQNTQIDEINKLMLLNAKRNIYFTNNVNLHYIKKLINDLPEFNKKEEDMVQVFGKTNDKLICFSGKKINFEANFKFLTIREEALLVSVPMHAQGLLRPASEYLAKKINELKLNKDDKQPPI